MFVDSLGIVGYLHDLVEQLSGRCAELLLLSNSSTPGCVLVEAKG
jgi:hypothetical protein